MSRAICTVLAASALVLGAGTWAAGQAKGPAKGPAKLPLQPFNGSLAEAYQRAVDRNVPVLVVALAEHEGEAEHADVAALRKHVLEDPEFADVALYTVPVLACNLPHAVAEVEVDNAGAKSKRKVCAMYRTETCKVHQKLFESVYREYAKPDGEMRSPVVLVVGPDRSVQLNVQTGDTPAVAAITAAIAAARTKAGEGLTEQQLIDVRDAIKRGTAADAAAQWGPSYRAWNDVLAITRKTVYADGAREQQAKALAALEKQRDEGLEWLKTGRGLDGYKRLIELQATANGTPLERELPKLITAAEGDKDAKDAIAAYKRELEADALWREAQKLFADKQAKPAEAKVRLLIRKFGATPAGKLAREKYATWAAEEDAKKQSGAN
jgi:hypothetical protein